MSKRASKGVEGKEIRPELTLRVKGSTGFSLEMKMILHK